MFIQNISYREFQLGHHVNSNNMNAIQIVDPCMNFPKPKNIFNKIYQFEFSDVETPDELCWEARMSKNQAKEIIYILNISFKSNEDIIVHCVSGKSRSGAVVEAGLLIGFKEITNLRQPNNYMLNIFSTFFNK